MKTLCIPLVIIALLAVSGCAHTYRLTDGGEQRLQNVDAVDVFLSPRDAQRVERVKMASLAKSYAETGSVWRRAFRGMGQSKASIAIGETEMRGSPASMGFAIRFTYTASATLTVNGREYALYGTGSRAAAMNHESAMRQAAELAVADIAKQAKHIITQTAPPPQPVL